MRATRWFPSRPVVGHPSPSRSMIGWVTFGLFCWMGLGLGDIATAEAPRRPETTDFLLITSGELLEAFQPLLDWKTRRGVPAMAVTVEAIAINYPGRSLQEKIKHCILDHATNAGTAWVLLGGDDAVVPDYDCYGRVDSMEGPIEETTIPTDAYYAGLDVLDWDGDGDGQAGEADEDAVDLVADVALGRLPVRTEAQAEALVAKVLAYEQTPPTSNFATRMILAGTTQYYHGDAEIKSETMYVDWIVPYGQPQRLRFYDTATDFEGGPGYDLNRGNLDQQLLEGCNFLHLLSAGSAGSVILEGGDRYTVADALAVGNAGACPHVLTVAGEANAFENARWEPCLAEAWLRNPGGGAVSFIGSSRRAWCEPGFELGPSMRFSATFYRNLFSSATQGLHVRLGEVLARTKSELAEDACSDQQRWLLYSMNLCGDPEMPVYTADPLELEPAYPPTVTVGAQTLEVTAGVRGARVCLVKTDEVYARATADASGTCELSIDPLTEGDLSLVVTAPNHLPFEGVIAVEGGGPLNEAWVDFGYEGPSTGSRAQPFTTLRAAADAIAEGGRIRIDTAHGRDYSEEAPSLDRACRITVEADPVRIGISAH